MSCRIRPMRVPVNKPILTPAFLLALGLGLLLLKALDWLVNKFFLPN